MKPELYALIVAGGKGLRMGNDVPKQFLEINGKPILAHTISAFQAIGVDQIIVVLPQNQIDYWKGLTDVNNFTIPHKIVSGGESRFESVKNGLEEIPNQVIVAIHDGVRPFLSKKVLIDSYESAIEYGSGVASILLTDSIRSIDRIGNSTHQNRDNFRLIQTPQTFKSELIKSAYNTSFSDDFTDDASVAEKAGNKIHLTQGDKRNIKITTSDDLILASVLVDQFPS